MKIMTGAALAAFSLMLAACGDGDGAANVSSQGPIPQIAAPNNGDWTQLVSRTPEGGTRIGNPNAPVKLVEYGSLTCPACKAFSDTATQSLRDTYVRSGQVSWEFRHLIIHGAADVVLAMLSDCQPQSAFFRTIEDLYEQQPEIVGRFEESEQRQIGAMPADQQVAAAARAMEVGGFFAQRGLPEGRQNQCLANQQAIQQLADSTNRAFSQEGVAGTPTFFLNGDKLDVSNWRDLEPLLRERIGG
ncbi:MAG TPA: thioredoxin domain-containing protein [Allosphingosinicella sp.]|nr:thioredoxin domain-containing protein [Allosphingosinicella sp.]HYG31200.1 thioredoxin domain-containing protein [Allosphingosinicella sp.]